MKVCQVKSGKHRGKLKKGYRWGRGGRCIKSSHHKRHRKHRR